MILPKLDRRRFLKGSTGVAALGAMAPVLLAGAKALDRPKKEGLLSVGCIGVGDRWRAIGPEAMKFGEVIAVCDVDRKHLEAAQETTYKIQDRKPDAYEDYRRVLDRRDIDVIVIATPDHWHAKCSIEAMKAGKDVYCEKPLTLTIEEGKQICRVARETGRVFQVGTTQRSEFRSEFIQALALIRDGRIGKIQKISCVIGDARTCDKLKVAPVPAELNWDMWLGQAPMTDFLAGGKSDNEYPPGRSHYHFRWWYEYSGGRLTDWGAHHIDIAHWALGADNTGPLTVEGSAEFPVPFRDGMPTESDRYNTATKFNITCTFANDVIVEIHSDGRNGITFEGDQGTIFVNRGGLKGKPYDALRDHPLPEQVFLDLYKGKRPGNHMHNFFECVDDRTDPISDVFSHHRAISTCHLANIAIRLGRKIEWDPVKELIIGDSQANTFLSREQRKGYEIVA